MPNVRIFALVISVDLVHYGCESIVNAGCDKS